MIVMLYNPVCVKFCETLYSMHGTLTIHPVMLVLFYYIVKRNPIR